MSEKQEAVETNRCQECKSRVCGAEAKREERAGWCGTTKKYVARKRPACEEFSKK